MKNCLAILLAFTLQVSIGQDLIDWDGQYQLQLVDFHFSDPDKGDKDLYLNPAIGIGFDLKMTSAEFVFTKNFNSKVDCTFDPSKSSLVAKDATRKQNLVNFARYSFDLAELHARKLREKLYENKGVFSNADFFRPIFDEMNRQYKQQYNLASKETDIGQKEEKLKAMHLELMEEINAMSDFCKECKPPKRSKKK